MENEINNKIRVKVGPSGKFRTIAVKKHDLEMIKNKIIEKRQKQIIANSGEQITSDNKVFGNSQTPAELLANELSKAKIQEEVKVISKENRNKNAINNDVFLGIINKITKIQGDLDSIGEDVIELYDLKTVSKENASTNVASTIKDTSVLEQSALEQEQPKAKVISLSEYQQNKENAAAEVQIINEPTSNTLDLKETEVISPFSIDPGSPNIFDTPEDKSLAA